MDYKIKILELPNLDSFVEAYFESQSEPAFKWESNNDCSKEEAFDYCLSLLEVGSDTYVVVALDSADIVAAFAIVDNSDSPIVFLQTLYVCKNHRRLGLGSALLNEIEGIRTDGELPKQVYLFVVASNTTARMLYTKHDYFEIGRHPDRIIRNGVSYDYITLLRYIPEVDQTQVAYTSKLNVDILPSP